MNSAAMHMGYIRLLIGSVLLVLVGDFEVVAKTCGGNNRQELDPSTNNPRLYLLSILHSPSLQLSAQFAVQLINNRSDILPDYQLELLQGDSACLEELKAVETYVRQVFHSGKHPVGIIGPQCSPSAIAVSKLNAQIGPNALVHIHLDNSPSLGNRTLYPYSFGVLSSSSIYTAIFFGLLRASGWGKVVVFYEDSLEFGIFSEVEHRVADNVPDTAAISFITAVYDTYLPLNSVRDSLARVIIIITSSQLAAKLACMAYHEGLRFPSYQMVFIARYFEDFDEDVDFRYKGVTYFCSKQTLMTEALNGSIFINRRLTPISHNATTVSGMTYTEYHSHYKWMIDTFNTECDENISVNQWATAVFDAVWSLALSLNNSISHLNQMNRSLSAYDKEIVDIVKEEIYHLEFEGVSGNISFDPRTGYNPNFFDFFQIFSGNAVLVGLIIRYGYTSLESENEFVIDDTLPSSQVTAPYPLALVFIVVTILEVLTIGCTHILAFVFRNRRPVKTSSPKLNNLIYTGCYLLAVSEISYITLRALPFSSHTANTVLCNLSLAWSLNIGFTLVYGTLLVRAWRIYHIFKSAMNLQKARRAVSDLVLFQIVALFVLVDIIFCTVWVSVDPVKGVVMSEIIISSATQEAVVEHRLVCESQYFLIWISLSFVKEGVLLFMVFLLVILSHKKVQYKSHFQTNNKMVILLVYVLVPLYGLGIPVYLVTIIQFSDYTDVIVLCLVQNVFLFLCLSLLFLPLIPVLKPKLAKHSVFIHHFSSR